jgi:hypothetical protein
MTNDNILDEIAKRYGLEHEEAHLALCYAAASRDATLRNLTASPDEAKRLKGMKRLRSLTLDLYQRLRVAASLPRVFVDERQYNHAVQLGGTSQELRRLEETLFGEPRTPKDELVIQADRSRLAYRRTHPTQPKTPTPCTDNRSWPKLNA